MKNYNAIIAQGHGGKMQRNAVEENAKKWYFVYSVPLCDINVFESLAH